MAPYGVKDGKSGKKVGQSIYAQLKKLGDSHPSKTVVYSSPVPRMLDFSQGPQVLFLTLLTNFTWYLYIVNLFQVEFMFILVSHPKQERKAASKVGADNIQRPSY